MSKLKMTIAEIEKILPEIRPVYNPETKEIIAYTFKHGPYKGVTYAYLDIKFEEMDDSDMLTIKFDKLIYENPNNVDVNSSEFINAIGDILVKIIEKSLEEMEDGDGKE